MMPMSVNTSPNTDTTPAVKSSLSTSTSVVTRVISRPHRVPVVEPKTKPLQVLVDPHPQVEHDPLPGDLHCPALYVLEREGATSVSRKNSATRPRPDRSPAGM